MGAILAAPTPLAVTVQTILHQVDSFVLLSLPLFILAGALMETGGIAHRLVRLAVALVGWVRGGLGMAVVAAEYIFSGISGSTVADVSAVAVHDHPGRWCARATAASSRSRWCRRPPRWASWCRRASS